MSKYIKYTKHAMANEDEIWFAAETWNLRWFFQLSISICVTFDVNVLVSSSYGPFKGFPRLIWGLSIHWKIVGILYSCCQAGIVTIFQPKTFHFLSSFKIFTAHNLPLIVVPNISPTSNPLVPNINPKQVWHGPTCNTHDFSVLKKS